MLFRSDEPNPNSPRERRPGKDLHCARLSVLPRWCWRPHSTLLRGRQGKRTAEAKWPAASTGQRNSSDASCDAGRNSGCERYRSNLTVSISPPRKLLCIQEAYLACQETSLPRSTSIAAWTSRRSLCTRETLNTTQRYILILRFCLSAAI